MTQPSIKKNLLDIELSDGTVHTGVRVTIREQLHWETTARKRKWDKNEQQILGTVFVAWSSLLNQHLLPEGTTFEDFRDRIAVDVVPQGDSDGVEDDADPLE